jgi:hypothetical protein
MSLLFVIGADGSRLPYEESQAVEMLRKGILPPETFYWREGMPQQRKLKELNSSGPPLPIYTLTTKIEPLTTIVLVMLVVSLIVAFLKLVLGFAIVVHTAMDDMTSIKSDAHMMIAFAWISYVVYALTVIPFIIWFYRVSRNCHAFVNNMTLSAGMTVGSFFIPFLNFVYPCIAMQETFKVSRSPSTWKNDSNSIFVGFWWGFWLLSALLGLVISLNAKFHLGFGGTSPIGRLYYVGCSLIVFEASRIILYLLSPSLVYIIARNQMNLTQPSSV